MCGICGIVDLDRQPVPAHELAWLRDSLAHRGPDDSGSWFHAGVALGSRRLAVIDLSPSGHMPMSNDDGTVWITYNGELYNFRELRRDLEQRGHCFRSRSDTEVVVHAYEEWGNDCVTRLSGMFAFAIWDERRRRLFAARDRLGVKPFAFVHQGRRFVFASEMHALYRYVSANVDSIDPLALDYYLGFGYVPPDRGLVRGLCKLPPGHRLVFDESGVTIDRWWQVSFRPTHRISAEDAVDEVERRLRRAVEIRLVSDVPIGCFLSGGIDSGLVTALAAQLSAQPLNTFSVGFGEASSDEDERPLARLVAERYGTRHTELIVDPGRPDLLPRIVRHVAEPFADVSALAVFEMSQEARRFITVALSGDGGDESFAGYANVRAAWWAERFATRLPEAVLEWGSRAGRSSLGRAAPLLARAGRWIDQYARRDALQQFDHETLWPRARRADLYSEEAVERLAEREALEIVASVQRGAADLGMAERVAYTDLQLRLPGDYLVKVDIASSMASLEVRSPFLDYELVEFAARLPFGVKMLGGRQKGLLRRLAARHLPAELLHQKKRGFAPRLGPWLRGPWSHLVKDLLPGGSLVRSGLFRAETIVATVDEHLGGRTDHGSRLYALLCLELWWRIFVDRSLDPGGAA